MSWFLGAALLVVALAQAFAVPVDENNNPEEKSTGSKTFHAVRAFFRPVTDYFFKKLPNKTPSDVATDVKEQATEVKEWAQENQAVQSLVSSLTPVKNWLKDKANVLKDTTFKEMYEDVKTRVSNLDERIGTWIQEHNTKQ